MKVKVALCQMPVEASVEVNLGVAKAYIQRAADGGAQIVCLPEVFNGLYNNASFVQNAEVQGGRSYQMLAQAARQHAIYLVGGSIIERDGADIYNTCYIFNPSGELIGRHRKVHLFDINVENGIRFMESETLTAGEDLTIVDTEFGKIGVAICFDIRFAEWFRLLSEAGAQAVFIPAAFNMTTGPAHWELSFRARALDGQMFMLGCSPARDVEGGYVAYGHSIVVNPWGTVLKQLSEKPDILWQEIDLAEGATIRNQIPIIKNMRRDLYEVRQR